MKSINGLFKNTLISRPIVRHNILSILKLVIFIFDLFLSLPLPSQLILIISGRWCPHRRILITHAKCWITILYLVVTLTILLSLRFTSTFKWFRIHVRIINFGFLKNINLNWSLTCLPRCLMHWKLCYLSVFFSGGTPRHSFHSGLPRLSCQALYLLRRYQIWY